MAKKIKIERPDKVTLNIQIPRDLHDRFKVYAIERNEPMRFFVQKAIRELLNSAAKELQKAQMQGAEF